jgi:nucleolar protein 15
MAPELRKRKPSAASEKAAEKPAVAAQKKKPVQAKRKAAEESSPVSLKKQKSTKPSPSAKPASKKTKQEDKKPAVEDTRIDVPEDDSDSENEEDEEGVQALAAEIDPEDDSGAKDKSLFKPGQDVGKAPKINKKARDANAAPEEPGVIYIGRVPHGFYEHEMKQYFSQFGPISRLRLSRNKKTGASKHFAFVEFNEASTADIVSKTMDNYLLFGHILKCRVVPKEQVHDDLFKGANKRFKKVPWNKMAGNKLEKPLSETAWKDKIKREKNKRASKADKLKAIGYDFDLPELKDAPAPAPIAAIENGEDETKAIEAPAEEMEVEKAPEPVEEAEPEAKTVSAPKAKAAKSKATKAAKGKKAKA